MDLPNDCSIEQVMLMHRHGSRGPVDDGLALIQGLTYTLGNASEAIQHANLPPNLQFLKKGYTTELVADELTAVGRQQLFAHGVDFFLRYPHLRTDTFVAGNQSRVIESSHWFGQGYFGLNASNAHFITIPDNPNTPSWIRPWLTCPRYQDFGHQVVLQWIDLYIPAITKRLNKLLPGVGLTNADTHGALYACAYDLAAYDTSPWCDVFSPTELSQFEYELDVYAASSFGHNLPNNMGPVMGSTFVKKLIERFTDSTDNSSPLYLEFGHDATIDLALTAMGLAKDRPPLSPTGPIRAARKWRTSNQVPFAANMVWEKFTCSKSFEGPQIRLVLNEATFPLTVCTRTHEDKVYGTCSLDSFIAANQFSLDIEFGDAQWDAACGAAVW
ncbi:phosphoglycerate mutase-like protein [Leucogyrophana mollusca]|uniref:Phosphoglycerate mutase-like protein n=1 Tax=Leucogyrophana mollusca TaxID=85980 RepID=A0ACB8B970_9AGAM|nr:phosphoglycerate mutase-like protein [Leucogyrophana mollusca]